MMTSYDIANARKSTIMEDAMVVALAVVAIQGRKEDELSENEAFSLYDRGWIKDRTARGMLHTSRKGATSRSAKIYSRFEIECLKRAEKDMEREFDAAQHAATKLQEKL